MRRIALFIVSFVIWNLLVWPVDAAGKAQWQDIGAGAVVALVVAMVMREITTRAYHRWVSPVRIFWAIAYLFVLVWNIVRANVDVAYRVLHPGMPIRPGVVKVKTRLTSATAIALLANSITLTPGTHTVDASDNGDLYVHWINVKTTDTDKASEIIVAQYEWFLKRIFE